MLSWKRSHLWIFLPLAVFLACAGDDDVGATDTSDLPWTTSLTSASAGATASAGASASAGTTTSASASGASASDSGVSTSTSGMSTSAGSAGVSCGDGVCDADEGCSECPADCGVCEMCTEAPTCPGDPTPPPINTHLDALDIVGMQALDPYQIRLRLASAVESGDEPVRLLAAALATPTTGEPEPVAELRQRLLARPELRDALLRSFASAGMVSPALYRDTFPPANSPPLPLAIPSGDLSPRAACSNPHIRVRVARLDVVEEDDDFLNDVVYCLFSTEAAAGSELRVTKPTAPLDEGDYAVYSLAEGVIWGQDGQLRAPGGNLLITYNCFESESDDGFAQLLELLGDAADSLGGVPGSYGWVFKGASGVANIIAMALALDNDDHLLSDQQSLSPGIQIQAANGVYWLIDRSGTNLNSDWNWVLRMEAWGCAEG